MSFNAANDPRELYTLLGFFIATGGVLAWRVKREGADPGRIVSHCSDGTVIGAWKRGVRRRVPRRRDRVSGGGAAGIVPGRDLLREDLEPGDLQFVRIHEAPAGESGWYVEAMDSEPRPFRIRWRFDTPDEAMAAFRLIQERILDVPVDPVGRPIELTDRDFEARWQAADAAGGATARS